MTFQGIIIRTEDTGEKDKILTVASTKGIVRIKARGVRTPSSKLKSYVGVLTFGDFMVTKGRAGLLLCGADVLDSFFACWTDKQKYAAAMCCLEIFEKSFRQADGKELALFLRAMKEINYGDVYPPAIALHYGVKAAAALGIDIGEGIFPEEIGRLFTVLFEMDETEVGIMDKTQTEIDTGLRHLAAGFESELGIKLTVVHEILKFTEEPTHPL